MFTAEKAYVITENAIRQENDRIENDMKTWADGQLTDYISKAGNSRRMYTENIPIPANVDLDSLRMYVEGFGYKIAIFDTRECVIDWSHLKK